MTAIKPRMETALNKNDMKPLKRILYMLLLMLAACEKDEVRLTLQDDATPAVITSTPAQLTTTISGDNLTDALEITWSEPDYGVKTQVTYTVEMDVACHNFSNPIVLASTADRTLPVTLDVLNTKKLISDLKLPQFIPSQVSIRVRSAVREFATVSAPVTFTVTPYSAWARGLWLISDAWSDTSAPAIYAADESAYDGYLYLEAGKAFRFGTGRVCGKILYGGSDGNLTAGSAQTIAVSESGYYRVKADTQALTYELTRINSFGAIGSATAGGWNSSSELTYDPARQVWEGVIPLISGALKFRANNDWAINYGPASDDLTGTLRLDDPGAISIAQAGTYLVTLDVSKTKSPDFTYAVVEHNDTAPPATLWVPGGYQGWNPWTAPTIKALNADIFEGYVYISTPTGYKFTSAPDWDHINYGDAGSGNLTTDGLADGMGLGTAGVYRFNVNISTLKYTAVLINTMGMVGPATASGSDAGWSTSVPMNYDVGTDTWQATIDLSPGALKFRANNEWTINYGPANSADLTGTLIFDDPGAINITPAGTYTVTVDFSRSAAPYKYVYRVVKN